MCDPWAGGSFSRADINENGGGVDVYSNGADEGTGESCGGGDHYQCVELVNRLYQAKGWISEHRGPEAAAQASALRSMRGSLQPSAHSSVWAGMRV